MKIGLKGFWAGILILGVLKTVSAADTNPAAKAPAEAGSPFKTAKERESYSIGMNIGNGIKRGNVDLDLDLMMSAIKDVLAGKDLKLTDMQAREGYNEYIKDTRAKSEEARVKAAEKNKKEGEAFLAENKKKPGVKTKMVTLPDGTTGELQYKVLTEGTGPKAGSNDTVTVNYKGTLINGKEFDSSARHGGQPAKFNIHGVIVGWTEALQMMNVGSKWEIYLPPSLAYKDQQQGPMIEPGSTLIFEIDLISSEPPAPPTPPQPLTSDIIRVPSAEELKAGSNIQVLKPEDVERLTREAAKAGSTNKAPKK